MKFIKENFDKSVEVERKITRFLENKKRDTERPINLSENEEVESIYQITYFVANGIFSSVMIKASSEEEARDKFSKKHKTKKIAGAKKISKDEADDMKKRGMSLVEEFDKDAVEKLAKKHKKPVLFICGQLEEKALQKQPLAPSQIAVLADFAPDAQTCMEHAAVYLHRAAKAV